MKNTNRGHPSTPNMTMATKSGT